MTQPIEIGIESKTFDNFALDCARNCPTYYLWRIVEKVVKAGAKKTPADFGSSIHSSLEHYYSKGMTTQAIKEALNLFVDQFTPYQDIADDKRTLGKGLEILGRYFSKYRREPFNVVATEVGGAVELGEYLYTFRIDLVVEWLSPKGIYGVDHKTTSSLYRMVVKPNNQITGYTYALNETYPDVIGYMINAIGVYKSDKQKDKVTGKMVEREFLVRLPTSRTRVEIEQWKVETLHLIHQIEEWQERDVWPKYTNFCTAYAGKCAYLDLCQAQDRSILKPLVEAEVYQVQPWTPYKGVEEGGEEE